LPLQYCIIWKKKVARLVLEFILSIAENEQKSFYFIKFWKKFITNSLIFNNYNYYLYIYVCVNDKWGLGSQYIWYISECYIHHTRIIRITLISIKSELCVIHFGLYIIVMYSIFVRVLMVLIYFYIYNLYNYYPVFFHIK